MTQESVEKLRQDARTIFDAAVRAVDAEECVRRFVSLEGDSFVVGDGSYDLSQFEQILAVGTGKASPRMGVALEDILGARLTSGIVNTK